VRTLSIDQARRIALGAQGFAPARPAGRADVRHLRRVLEANSVVQVDSVNVTARAHYLPFWSRLGDYDVDRLDDLLWRDRECFEYWGHAASVMPHRVHRLMRYRMDRTHPWTGVRRLAEEHPGYVEQVLEEVREDGPLTVGELADAGQRGGPWWGWSNGRMALDWLFTTGAIAIAQRDRAFTLHYDVPERVIPADVLAAEPASVEEAHRELLYLGAKAHGVGTLADLADHFRLKLTPSKRAAAELVAAGRLEEVQVRGWDQPAYLDPEATLPRRIGARAVLAPFDPVVWFRDRAERLFDFHYRIEIYVPKPQRTYGYYVLPFLLDDRLVGRVDLKSDRQAGVLRVPGAFAEPGEDRVRVGRELAAELREYAAWEGLSDVVVGSKGDLVPALRAALD
jgi:uncharacterized protein YcaQ